MDNLYEWFHDDITWCGNECSHTECERNIANRLSQQGMFSVAMFKNTTTCPLYKEENKMDWNYQASAPQGWQCPICHAVWSPTTPMCYNCTGKERTFTVSSGTYKVDDINKYIENINTNAKSNITFASNPSTKTIHNGETDYDK